MDTLDSTTTVTLLTSVVATLYAVVALAILQRRRTRRAEERLRELEQRLRTARAGRRGRVRRSPGDSDDWSLSDVITDVLERPTSESVASDTSGSDLEDRLARLEARLPSPETLASVASVNEAVLATKLEHLEKDLAKIEARLLGRGDVVLVVFGVLTALGVVVAIVRWVAGS